MALKTALVTGAGSGIGRAVALGLLQSGYAVVLAGRREDRLQAVRGEAASSTRQEAHVVATDVRDPVSVDALFAAIRAKLGRLDLLFNCAGIPSPRVPIEDLKAEDWRNVIDTNLTGLFLCAQGAFRLMKEQRPNGGRIINCGSISAQVPRPNAAPYNASKSAVTGLTKSIALEGRSHDIACGQIDVGNASSQMTEVMSQGILQADGRLATEPTMAMENVTQAVLFMAGLPLEANVQFLTVLATKMPFIGRG